MESVKRRFLIPNIPAGKITQCRGHEAARELQVEPCFNVGPNSATDS